MRISGDREPYIEVNSVEGLDRSRSNLGARIPSRGIARRSSPTRRGALSSISIRRRMSNFLESSTPPSNCANGWRNSASLPSARRRAAKGLHVVTPLKPSAATASDWKEAKMFAGALCQQMADDSPRDYLIKDDEEASQGADFSRLPAQ